MGVADGETEVEGGDGTISFVASAIVISLFSSIIEYCSSLLSSVMSSSPASFSSLAVVSILKKNNFRSSFCKRQTSHFD
ncbi:hypothetical protein BpHYR1_006006 [Brachionus plicatilis]|uniref:Uncharacterized protein n=1 Tax=Brachionus plicatilis TaxID=10195 RepID=A0A3M7SWF0_BRAPC|nr:hypothetical protein BpHYR1_006006 [Brachionus plicatilis]